MGLGLTLVLFPGILLPLLGLPVPTDVWIRVGGMMMFFMGCFDVLAAMEGWTAYFRMSVPLRLAVPLFFGAFVMAKWAPLALIPMGFADLFGALWTMWALRMDAART